MSRPMTADEALARAALRDAIDETVWKQDWSAETAERLLRERGYEVRPIPVDGICDIVVSFHPKDGGHPCDNWRPIEQAAEAADREAADEGEGTVESAVALSSSDPSAAADTLARALDNLLRHHNAGSAHAISRPLHECEFARSALAALEQAAEAADREAAGPGSERVSANAPSAAADPLWQRCPVCEGHGTFLPRHPLPVTNPYVTCHVCGGKGYIAAYAAARQGPSASAEPDGEAAK